jgi:hypothetical protein
MEIREEAVRPQDGEVHHRAAVRQLLLKIDLQRVAELNAACREKRSQAISRKGEERGGGKQRRRQYQ